VISKKQSIQLSVIS